MGQETHPLYSSDSGSPQVDLSSLPEQYELLGKVSEGGMGSIYKAQNRYTNVMYAIKVLRADCADDQELRQRFILEAKAASSLKHPNICQVHDFGITKTNTPYLVMDWIDGISLQAKLERDGPLNSTEAVFIFQQVASALGFAHQHKVIHRDLKPENIMMSRATNEGRTNVQLVDFGIAKLLGDEGDDMVKSQGLTKSGMILGTPLYMSPEQALGRHLDKRSDIYSFGCVMYFALAGAPPFVGESFVATANMHMSEAPPAISPNLKVSPDLRLIMLRAMEKNPNDRYETMEQLATDLKKLTKGVTIQRVALADERQKKQKRKMVILYFILGFVIMYIASMLIQNLLEMIP